MASDLSVRPWFSAAIAPLAAPIGMAALFVLDENGGAAIGELGTTLKVVATIWLVAYAHMWLLAVPVILLTRRWIRWSWPRLIALGALLGALPWAIAVISELRGRADLSVSRWASELLRSLILMDDYIVLKLGVLPGAFVAGVFCLLQLRRLAPASRAVRGQR